MATAWGPPPPTSIAQPVLPSVYYSAAASPLLPVTFCQEQQPQPLNSFQSSCPTPCSPVAGQSSNAERQQQQQQTVHAVPRDSPVDPLPAQCPIGANLLESNAVKQFASSLQGQCSTCNEDRVGYAFFIFGIVIVAAIYAVVLYVRGVHNAKEYLAQKIALRTNVKSVSQQTSSVIGTSLIQAAIAPAPSLTPPSTATFTPTTNTNPIVSCSAHSSAPWDPLWEWLASVEASTPCEGRGSYYFVMGFDGRMYAHGRPKALTTRSAMDTAGEGRFAARDTIDGTTETTDRVVSTAKTGGGFVYFADRKDRPMGCYCYPIRGFPMLIGGTFRVPNHSRGRARMRLAKEHEAPSSHHLYHQRHHSSHKRPHSMFA